MTRTRSASGPPQLLADRISCRMLVETIIPDTAGLDWNDVLLRRSQ